MTVKKTVFQSTYEDYVVQLKGIDYECVEQNLGVQVKGNEITIHWRSIESRQVEVDEDRVTSHMVAPHEDPSLCLLDRSTIGPGNKHDRFATNHCSSQVV